MSEKGHVAATMTADNFLDRFRAAGDRFLRAVQAARDEHDHELTVLAVEARLLREADEATFRTLLRTECDRLSEACETRIPGLALVGRTK